MNKTEEIIMIVEKNTKINKGTSVGMISEELQRSKNFVSQEMNSLIEMNVLFCIKEKELLYFHKASYEETNHCILKQLRYASMAELMNVIHCDEKRDFEKLIGFQDSLATCVEHCKAAISYPKNSLPTLLLGPTGSGKSYIAQLMYEYAINHGIIGIDKPFVTLNCSEYANNPELLTANLFGHKKGAFTGAEKDNLGLIQVANGGVLFLDEVHCLKAECQEKLFLFMDKGIYHKVGENEKWDTSEVRFIFATTQKPEEVLLKTFLRRVPITITIPSLKERGVYERIQLIHDIFIREEEKISKTISISNFVYNMFLAYEFEGNIGELINTIKVCCANAMNETHLSSLEIHMKHLPNKLFAKKMEVKYLLQGTDDRMMNIHDFTHSSQKNQIIQLYDQILSVMMDFSHNHDCVESLYASMKVYYDQIIYDKKEGSDYKSGYILNEITMIVKDEFKRYGISINNNNLLLLFKYFEDVIKNPMWTYHWSKKHFDAILQLNNDFSHIFQREIMIAEEIVQLINMKLDVMMDEIFVCILALNMRMMASELYKKRRIGIIIAHGYSTASSIAHAVNQLLDCYVFESIDMPIEVTTKEIVDTLNAYLSKMCGYEDLILLVDMGSLEEIYKGITIESDANIGIINNITTKMALQIGSELYKDTSLDELLKEVCESNAFHYRIIEKKKKEDVIICACVSGIGTAQKIKELLMACLPLDCSLNILTVDYNRFVENKGYAELQQKYNILCMIGTLNPDIEHLVFIPIEELIVNQNTEIIEELFHRYMNVDGVREFKKNLLKNFSLTNIMEYLTILNPNKLLEHVAAALDHFQQLYHIQIKNSTCIGLYVHACCMIERLVTHQPFDHYNQLESMTVSHKEFIECIQKAFENVENYYGIKIPLDEIGFMFDYIQNNS